MLLILEFAGTSDSTCLSGCEYLSFSWADYFESVLSLNQLFVHHRSSPEQLRKMDDLQRHLSLLKEYEEACKVILNEIQIIQNRMNEDVAVPPFGLLLKLLLLLAFY